MKVIKAVGEGAERRTYVEGGPKCAAEYYAAGLLGWGCVGGRKFYDRKYTLADIEPYYGDDCSDCHGTGLIPVEQYSDEQLDAFLNTHFETWDLRMRRELHTNEPIYSVEGRPDGFNMPCDDTSRGAKIWAVIAVAEEEK